MEGSPDGQAPPPAWRWLARDLAARGGRLSAATRREPKARHGRHEERRLWALHDPEVNAYLGWPHLRQVCRLERRRTEIRQGRAVKSEVEVTYLVTARRPSGPTPSACCGPTAATGASRIAPTGCAT
jgi:hypothetical protein